MGNRRARKIIIAWWLAVLQWLLERYVKVDEQWVESVREAAQRGRVVFVLRNRSLIDFLCLRGLCEQYDLPRVSFVTGIPSFLYLPFWLWLFRLFTPTHHNEFKRRFSIGLRSGGSAVVFLRRPAAGGSAASLHVKVDGIRIAVEVQSSFTASIIALPTVFLWGENAMKRFPGTMDFVFGSNEYPRLLRSIWLLIRSRSVHQVMVGEGLELKTIQQQRGVEADALAGVIRAGVGRRIEMLRRSRLGSLTKPSSRVKAEVLGSPRLHRELARIAQEEGIPTKDIQPRARNIIKKLAADYHPRVLALLAMVMAFVWRRIYTGIEVSDEDMDKMREVAAKGPTLILPTHKSHIDYLAVSQVMRNNNIMLPHIAAGQNLSFWPLGFLFRSSGAFFIRRKFVDDRFYSSVVNAYIRRLVQEGYSIEIFIEGGRSRTGKLLRPKLGMLEMSIRALAVTPRLDLGVVPVFIGYERVIEETAYVKESLGRQKKSESIKGLIKSSKVLLTRYGRLYVRVGQPFTIGDVLNDLGLKREDLEKISNRRDVALETARRNYAAINKITVVTPSAVLATILLSQRGNTIEHGSLRERALWLVDYMISIGASTSEFVSKWREQVSPKNGADDFLDRTIRALVRGGRIQNKDKRDLGTYTIRDGQRLPLDYYKNNTIHFLVPSALVCTSCLVGDESGVNVNQIIKDVALVTKFWRWEFMISIEHDVSEQSALSSAEVLVREALAKLQNHGVLREDDGMIHVVDRDKAILLSDGLRNIAETYFAVVSTIRGRVLGEVEGDTYRRSLALAQEKMKSGEFSKPEAHSRLNVQNALQAFKELKILRPAEGETPYEDGMFGDRIYQYLKSFIDLS